MHCRIGPMLTPTLNITQVLSQLAVAKNFPSGENCMCLTKAVCGARSYLTTSSDSFEAIMFIFDRADTGSSIVVLLRSGIFLPSPDDVVRLRIGFGDSSFSPPKTTEDRGLSTIVSKIVEVGEDRSVDSAVLPEIAFCILMCLIAVFQSCFPTVGTGIESSPSNI